MVINMSVTKTNTAITKELYEKLLMLIQMGFYEYGYCSFYIASLNCKTIEIFANDKVIFQGKEATCKKIFKELTNALEKSNKYKITGDKEYLTIRRN